MSEREQQDTDLPPLDLLPLNLHVSRSPPLAQDVVSSYVAAG